MKRSEPPIVVTQTFPTSASKVWKALTDPAEMRRWYFEPIKDFKPEVGFKTEFTVHHFGKDFPHLWEVREAVAEKKIAYRWRYGGFAGDSVVSFEIAEGEGSSTLTLTHTVLEDFPETVAEFSRENCETGWRTFIQQLLKQYLEGAPVTRPAAA